MICLDGCAEQYLDEAIKQGLMPHLNKMSQTGYRGLCDGALPSFTNVNNCAICTGQPPSETGICGNYFLDMETGKEVMMNSPEYLRKPTIMAAAARAGRKVAFVTAKDKLRKMLSVDLGGIAFSSEKVDEATKQTHGISNVEALVGAPKPEIYSGNASIYVLKSGVALIENKLADFLYLTTTDYIQHKYTPEEKEALEFYRDIDIEIGKMLELGALIGITADHGMNAKPDIIYLESELTKTFGVGYTVICPISDPYVLHHGALGAAVTVFIPDLAKQSEVAEWIMNLEGVTEVYTRQEAVEKLELASDRIGDLFVLCGENVVLGRTPEHHDLSQLDRPLRSHGGRYEQIVPLILSEPLSEDYRKKAASSPRNFDIFDFTCNGTTLQEGPTDVS